MAAKILTFLEVKDGKVRAPSLEAAGAAARLAGELGGEAYGALVGSGVEALAGSLAGAGLVRVYLSEDAALETFSQEGYAAALAAMAREAGATHVFLAHTIRGRDLAPRLAQRLEAGMASDVISLEVVDGRLQAERPIYAGKLLAKVEVGGEPALFSLRPKAFAANRGEGGAAPEVARVAWQAPASGIRVQVKDLEAVAAGKVDVSEADILVSGGRGVKSAEGFKPLEELAELLGGAVACSRPVAESGWRAHRDHVGQTGKTVSPTIYFACGISGAIQHMAGVSSAKVIVAINKDPNAPVFEKADYGIVGDLFEVVPRLTEEIRALGE